MGRFKRADRMADYNDPALDSATWLRNGESRYQSLVPRHYGSPDTIALGGDKRATADDQAAALFFYQKAIDTLHSIYVCGFNDTGPASWRRQPSPRDDGIIDRYLATLAMVRARRPDAPIGPSVKEVTHRLRTISSQFRKYGLDSSAYLDRLNQLGRIAWDVDVSGIFWS